MTSKHISIRGAREHNLKNVSLDLPREELVVITGLSMGIDLHIVCFCDPYRSVTRWFNGGYI